MQRPDPARFADAVAALIGRPLGNTERIAVAVSGGPDSLALLLLASEAFGSRVCGLTVDHGLRAEATAEAAYVADICDRLGIGHVTLKLEWSELPTGNVQAVAREARYCRMGGWCLDNGIAWLATAHHRDDQAETLLMRLSRGSGIAGLAGVRAKRPLSYRGGSQVTLLRPLLDWCRADLAGIVQAAGIIAIDDPTNRNHRYDRTHARQLLAATPWLQAERLATVAHHLADANDALEWVTRMAWRGRAIEERDGSVLLDIAGLPHEITRRLVLEAIDWFEHDAKPRGPDVDKLIERLMAGKTCTLAGVKAIGGPVWRFTWAPERKSAPSTAPDKD